MKQRILALSIVLLVIVAALALAGWSWQQSRHFPMTDAGEVTAPVVQISAIVPGQVIEVAVENNQAVTKGDLLFRVDPEPYQLQLDQAKAALATAEAELKQGQGNLGLEQSNADVAAKQIDRARANLDLAQQTLDRLVPLLEQGYVTQQEVDSARTAVTDAQVTFEQAQTHAQGAGDVVGTLDTRQAQVASAQAAVALAERNLRNCEIRAPRDGRITGMLLSEGEYVLTATPLFSLIDTAHWQVSALFRETDLAQIEVGAPVQVFLLAAPDMPVEGRVESIGWGVRSSEAAQLLGLPLVANKLDWVRAARRFPVEIELENPPEGLTRLGASATVRIIGGTE